MVELKQEIDLAIENKDDEQLPTPKEVIPSLTRNPTLEEENHSPPMMPAKIDQLSKRNTTNKTAKKSVLKAKKKLKRPLAMPSEVTNEPPVGAKISKPSTLSNLVNVWSEQEDKTSVSPEIKSNINTHVTVESTDQPSQLSKTTILDLTVEDEPSYFDFVPPEILRSFIFPYLNGTSYMRCRRVCSRWKEIIDEMSHDNMWRRFCREEWPEMFRAELKTSPDMTWYRIYRNWCMWPRLSRAARSHHTFPIADKLIDNVQVTGDGTLVVLQPDAIRFYDVRGQRPCGRHQEVPGRFLSYEENYRAIVLWGINKSLLITKRRLPSPQTARSVIYDNVSRFCLDKKNVYYVIGRRVYRCNLCRERMTSEPLAPVCEGDMDVVGLHVYQGRLYVRTSDFAVRMFHNNTLAEVVPPWSLTNRLGIFGQFFLVNNGDIIYSSDYRLRIHHGSMSREILKFPRVTAVRVYNNVLILGTKCGQVMFYRLKDQSSVIDFDPMDVLFRHYYGEDTPEQIISIDVVECRNGQNVVVSTKQSANLVKFLHFSSQ